MSVEPAINIPSSKNLSGSIGLKPEPSKLKMRILLIAKATIPFERNAIMFLSSSLKKQGYEVKAGLLDYSTAKSENQEVEKNQERIYKLVKDFKPHIVGYSCMTGEHSYILKMNVLLKKDFKFFSVMGGPHPTFDKSVIEEDGIDAICTGEGDFSFPEFVRRIQAREEWWLTPTFHVKYENKIYRNPLGDLIADLNKLPPPDRQILYDADPNLADISCKAFISARGCPYKCSYCFNKEYNDYYKDKGQVLRVKSPEIMVQEIEDVRKKYALDIVMFGDDVFTLKPQGWIEEFAKLYKKRVGLPFSCTARASSLKKEDVKILADCGLIHVWMGVECGDEKVANDIMLRQTTNEKILEVNEWFKEYNVLLLSLNIMGLPVDNPFEVDLATVDLNLKLKPGLASFNLLYPFPGTAIGRMAEKSGHFKYSEKTQFLETNRRSSMLNFKSKKEKIMVENLQKLAGIIVEFPFLRRFLPTLCKLPLKNFYHFLMYVHFCYCHKFRLRPPTFKSFIKELPGYWGTFKAILQKS